MAKKILIIDDDPTSNTLVSYLLKSHGFETVMATDGDEGLDIARVSPPDLIILDINMPKMDGFTFISELKAFAGVGIPPIIMLTAKENMQEVFKAEGVADYFVKPFNSEEFVNRVYLKLGILRG